MLPIRKAGLLGKKPVNPESHKKAAKFSAFFNMEALPPPPKMFGHYDKLGPLEMLGNDQVGNCVWAGFAHHVMYWNAAAGKHVEFTAADTISDYSAYTGYSKWKPFSDQGTDMAAAPDYFKSTGIRDIHNVRHKIDANIILAIGNIDELWQAMHLFDGAGIGVNLPRMATKQFENNQVWDVVPGDSIEGGHYVAGFGRNSHGLGVCATWGGLQAFTENWFQTYCDECQAYISLEMLDAKGLSPEQFDKAALYKYAAQVGN